MTLATYAHHEALTFPGYIDLATGRTLHAEPGGTYDIAPASGPAPDVPEPWFTPVQFAAGGLAEAAPEAEAEAAEPAAEPGEAEPAPDEPE